MHDPILITLFYFLGQVGTLLTAFNHETSNGKASLPGRLAPLSPEERALLMRTVHGDEGVDVWLKDGLVLNVFTGEWLRQHVWIKHDTIVYVGEKAPHDAQKTLDLSGYVLVPGYIEPHAHPFQLYHPYTLAEFALAHGTTVLIADNMMMFHALDLKSWQMLMKKMQDHPLHWLWWARVTPQARDTRSAHRYTEEALMALADDPHVIQAGELTDIRPLIEGDVSHLRRLLPFIEAGKRIEGHAPGASLETLTRLQLAGVTADHEAIDEDELLRRLRLGYYAALRHSSIRRDLPTLLTGLKTLSTGWERVMLTTDGSTPPFLEEGLTDALLRLAMAEGIPPERAYRMATLNPATYYRLDGRLGAIAPGRLADINILASISEPTPTSVILGGRISVQHGTVTDALPSFPYEKKERLWMEPALFTIDDMAIAWSAHEDFPVLHLLSDVITVLKPMPLPVHHGLIDLSNRPDLHYIYVLDREGKWLARGVISGFAQRPFSLASTYTASGDLLLIGSHPASLWRLQEAAKRQGGIYLEWEEDSGYQQYVLPLPYDGHMSDLAMGPLIAETKLLDLHLRALGFQHPDPIYTLLFLTSTHLPRVRMTEEGVYLVKEQKVVFPSKMLKR